MCKSLTQKLFSAVRYDDGKTHTPTRRKALSGLSKLRIAKKFTEVRRIDSFGVRVSSGRLSTGPRTSAAPFIFDLPALTRPLFDQRICFVARPRSSEHRQDSLALMSTGISADGPHPCQ